MTVNTLTLSPPKVVLLSSLGLSLPCVSAHICLRVFNEDEASVNHRALWQMEQVSSEITEGRGSRLREHPSPAQCQSAPLDSHRTQRGL